MVNINDWFRTKLGNLFTTLSNQKAIIIISLLGIIVFANSLPNKFIGDDISQLTNQQKLNTIAHIGSYFNGDTSLNTSYYKPLFNTSNAVIYSIFGPSEIAFHSFSITLHIISAILLFLVLTQFFKKPLALILTLIFLVHPINSEVVFYVSDLQDILFFFFGISALYKFTKAKSVGSIVLVSFLLFLSILSKETGSLFFLIVILYGLIFNRKYLYQLLGILGFTGLMYLSLRTSAFGFFSLPTLAPIAQLDLVERLYHIPAILFFYLKTFFIPLNLSTSYHWIITSIDLFNFYLPLIVNLLTLGLIVFCGIKLKKITDSTYFKTYLFFSLWLVIGLLLHLQIIPLDATVADRWFYFPIVGALGIIGTLLQAHNINLNNKYTMYLIVIILALISTRTFVRSFDWRNELILASHDIKVSDSHILENSLSAELFILGKYNEAKLHAEQSIKLFPYDSNYLNLGTINVHLGDYDGAKKAYTKSLEYKSSNLIYRNISVLAIGTGDNLDTIKNFIQSGLEKYPRDPMLLANLAIVNYKLGKYAEAKRVIKQAYNYDQGYYVKKIYEAIMSERLNLEFNLLPE